MKVKTSHFQTTFMRNKKIILLYLIFGIFFISLLLYWDDVSCYSQEIIASDFYGGTSVYETHCIDRKNLPSILPSELSEITLQKNFSIEQQSLFNLMTNVEEYPYILPSNVIDVKIIERSENIIIAQERLIERGIAIDLLVKHTFTPYQTHVIEILEGDASGTKVEQTFQKNGDQTLVENKITFELQGVLTLFKFLPESNVIHGLETVLEQFEIYAQSFDNETTQIIDKLYREILKRPVDKEGLEHYSILLESEQISPYELRQILMNSDERKSLLLPNEIKSIESLNSQTVHDINLLYQEILHRPADMVGLKHYGSLMEHEKLTLAELKVLLQESDERKMYDKSTLSGLMVIKFGSLVSFPDRKAETVSPFPLKYALLDISDFKPISEINIDTKESLDSLFIEILGRPIDESSLQYFGVLLDSKAISLAELESMLLKDCIEDQIRPCIP